MNREHLLSPDALQRVLNEEQFRLPLTHTQALHAIARLHGFSNWNAAAASKVSQKGLKRRAKVLRTEAGVFANALLLTSENFAAICALINAIELEDPGSPSILPKITAQDAELLGLFGAGASTAELYELMGTRNLDVPLLLLGSKIGAYSDPSRDDFAREHGFVQRVHLERIEALRARRRPLISHPTKLNLAAGVTLAAFRNLIAAQNDDHGHHTLWVDRSGMVHLDLVPEDLSPVQYELEIDNQMQFRYETFVQGCGYMGPTPAEDSRWVQNLLDSLKRDWDARAAGYIEMH